MVLEIRLENFFSIKDEILLDFRAANTDSKVTKALSANVIDYKGEKILKSIGLFGANASGKSNVLKAIDFCKSMIMFPDKYNEWTAFDFMPFKFDGYETRPSTFSIDFFHDGVEYEYSFTLTRTEILKESLYHYTRGRRAKVYTRDETKGPAKQDIYSFTAGLIPRPLDVAINTGKKTLYLSRASKMDRELCGKLYSFFALELGVGFEPLNFTGLGFTFPEEFAKRFVQNKDFFLHALSICDSDIFDIRIVHEKQKILMPIASSNSFSNQSFDTIRFETSHRNNPEIPFDLQDEESAGTKQMFNMLFPLLYVVKEGKTYLLDEFDQSLHAKLAYFVIDLFHAGSSAQFLFTSHNTNLIDVKRFRKDQIVFANKKEDGSTELYSLYDYKDFRENMDAEKGYLQGRFDAIPIVDNSLSALKRLLEGNKEPE